MVIPPLILSLLSDLDFIHCVTKAQQGKVLVIMLDLLINPFQTTVVTSNYCFK